MNLHSGAAFWLVRNGLRASRPVLTSPESCDVTVVGAGITGALVADALTTAGFDVVILDRRESGLGSTSASTALLQYEIDVEMLRLADKIGEAKARRAYVASAGAVAALKTICEGIPECSFTPRQSLYLASTRRDARRLREECDARAAIGLRAEWWDGKRVSATYGFPSHGAIRSGHSAEVDALSLTRGLLHRALQRGARWYEQTNVNSYGFADGVARLTCDSGVSIRSKYVVCAVGYELPEFLRQDRVALHSTFALVTERVRSFGAWDDGVLVWESARPYVYMRTTPDRRIIVGGEDVPFRNATWRDRLIPSKTRRLEARLRKLLPDVQTETAFEWAGTFAETPDGLPYIGEDERYPGVLFALGYGGNGITFSAIAAGILTAMCQGQSDRDADLYRMDRV